MSTASEQPPAASRSIGSGADAIRALVAAELVIKHGSCRKAAPELGISERAVSRLLQRHGIAVPEAACSPRNRDLSRRRRQATVELATRLRWRAPRIARFLEISESQ